MKLGLLSKIILLILFIQLTACNGQSDHSDGSSESNEDVSLLATAGCDQTVDELTQVEQICPVALPDERITSYQWKQTSGKAVSTLNPHTSTLSFTAPELIGIAEDILVFELVVSDQFGNTGKDSVSVTVKNTSILISESTIGDSNFNGCLLEHAAEYGWFYLDQVTELDCSARDILSLEDLSQLSHLTRLNISENQLFQLDLSGLVALEYMDASHQYREFGCEYWEDDCIDGEGLQLITLPLRPTLSYLDLSNNALRTIDMSNQDSLQHFDMSDQYVEYFASCNQEVDEMSLGTFNCQTLIPAERVTSYIWRQTSGTSVLIPNPTASTLNFTASELTGQTDEVLSFEVTVSDKFGNIGKNTLNVVVKNVVVENTDSTITYNVIYDFWDGYGSPPANSYRLYLLDEPSYLEKGLTYTFVPSSYSYTSSFEVRPSPNIASFVEAPIGTYTLTLADDASGDVSLFYMDSTPVSLRISSELTSNDMDGDGWLDSVDAEPNDVTLPGYEPIAKYQGKFNSVSVLGDVNNDGVVDIAIGDKGNDNDGFYNSGTVRVLSGKDFSELHAIYGTKSSQELGLSVDNAGDVNNDGSGDYLATSLTGAAVFSGKDGSIIFSIGSHYEEVYTLITDLNDSSVAIQSISDLNGDSINDFLIGYDNKVEIYAGESLQLIDVLQVEGDTSSGFGAVLRVLSDINQDGYPEIIVGARYADAEGLNTITDEGAVYVFSGKDRSLLNTVYGGGYSSHFGNTIDSIGDINGNGYDDLIVGALFWNANDDIGTGTVQVFDGKDFAPVHTFYGSDYGGAFGRGIAALGDVNQDGSPDFISSAPYDDINSTHSGSAKVFNGADGRVLYTLTGSDDHEHFGRYVASVGDYDSDGLPDFLISNHNSEIFIYAGSGTRF